MPDHTESRDAAGLCMELIARPSLTPEDGGCQRLLCSVLRDRGFHVENLSHMDAVNSYATHGSGRPVFCFLGHTDTVPPGDPSAWAYPPFEPSLHDGMIYGRGAADMKGGLAAAVLAAARFAEKRPRHPGTVACLFTSNEEGDSPHGTAHAVGRLIERGDAVDFCLIPGATSAKTGGDTVKIGRRGSLTAAVEIYGIQGHVAYPRLALNPLHAGIPALNELIAREWDRGDEHFPPTSMQIPYISAGSGAANVIPGRASLLINWRFSPATTAEEIKKTTEGILSRHRLNYRADWSLTGEPFVTRRGALVDAAHRAVSGILGFDPGESTGGGTSDGRFMARFPGCQIVELGPVSETIHKANECVSAADLEKLAAVYERILELTMGGA